MFLKIVYWVNFTMALIAFAAYVLFGCEPSQHVRSTKRQCAWMACAWHGAVHMKHATANVMRREKATASDMVAYGDMRNGIADHRHTRVREMHDRLRPAPMIRRQPILKSAY